MNYYEEFGIPRDAPAARIRQAYKTLAQILHPDAHSDVAVKAMAERQMRRLNAMLDTLLDPDKRRASDASLSEATHRRRLPPAEVGRGNSDAHRYLSLSWRLQVIRERSVLAAGARHAGGRPGLMRAAQQHWLWDLDRTDDGRHGRVVRHGEGLGGGERRAGGDGTHRRRVHVPTPAARAPGRGRGTGCTRRSRRTRRMPAQVRPRIASFCSRRAEARYARAHLHVRRHPPRLRPRRVHPVPAHVPAPAPPELARGLSAWLAVSAGAPFTTAESFAVTYHTPCAGHH